MKSLLDRYFRARIDRALDDARPLRGLTAWYVRRNPDLGTYYETMLEMELELRFPEINAPEGNRPATERPIAGANSIRVRDGKFSRRNRILAASALVALFAVVFGVSVLRDRLPENDSTTSIAVVDGDVGLRDDEKIDLGELLSLAAPWTDVFLPSEEVRPASAVPRSLTKRLSEPTFSVEPIVRFSERPLESTIAFFEALRVVDCRSTNIEN